MSFLALQDLFARCRDKATGVWRLGKDPSRTVFLDSGDIVFAQSTHPTDRLTYLLVERGKLTQAQMDYAMANLKPGLSIGKNLIQMGFITQRDLLDVARAQVERILLASLGTPDLAPAFEAKELEPNVVRLPFDTPSLLLNGILTLQDRERLLELLGPLNQVVLLEGRRIHEAALPADLSRLPPLLDGTRTLLELARETNVEPLRLGAFVLFLREIGWVRLHELPPLDRPSLDLALTQEPEPLSGPLPEAPEPVEPNLFATIQAAERPTTNLEHLSESLDRIAPPVEAEPGPAEETVLPPVEIHTGRIEIPTPNFELPEPPLPPPDADPEPEPPLPIAPPTLIQEDAPPPMLETGERKGPRWGLLLGMAALLAVGIGAGLWWKRTRGPGPVKAPEVPKVELRPPAASIPKVDTPAPPAAPEQKPAEPPVSRPAPAKALAYGREDRLAALRGGDLETALAQGAKHLEGIPGKDWVLRLEIACQGETLQKAARLLEGLQPDLFLRPLKMRDGKTCYQVFMGRYPSKAAAEKAVPELPPPFRMAGNKPRAFQVSDIPE